MGRASLGQPAVGPGLRARGVSALRMQAVRPGCQMSAAPTALTRCRPLSVSLSPRVCTFLSCACLDFPHRYAYSSRCLAHTRELVGSQDRNVFETRWLDNS